jgi:hypothetical protein
MKTPTIHSHFGGLEWLQIHRPNFWRSLLQSMEQLEGARQIDWPHVHQAVQGLAPWNTLLTCEESICGMECIWDQGIGVKISASLPSDRGLPFYASHQARFLAGQIEVGIEILPMKSMQAEMSSGPGYYEGALYDLARQGRGVPAVPLVLIGLEP